MTKKKFIYKMFDGKRFRLWATADTKSTAKKVAEAKRTATGLKYNARITKTKDKKSPYRIWIRAKGRKK